MAICSACSTPIPDAARFCPVCGAAAAASVQLPPQPGSPQEVPPQPGSPQEVPPQANQPQSYQQQSYQQPGYQQQSYQQQDYQPYQQAPADPGPVPPCPEAEQYRVLTALSYLSPIFLIILLILAKESNYVRKHANQALALIMWFVLCTLCAVVPFLGWLVCGVGSIAGFVFLIICFARALKYQMYEIPITGKWTIVPLKDE